MPRPCVSRRPLHDSQAAAGRLGALACQLAVSLAAALAITACSSPPARPPSPTQAAASASSERGARALQRGDWPQASAHYQAALQAAVALQDPALTAAALQGLSLASARQGDLPAALAHVERILAAPQHFDAASQARAAARKALLLLDAGNPDQALRWADRAGALCASPCTLAPVLDNLRAHLALARGDRAQAAALAQAAARTAQASGQDGEWASALRLQARALGPLGDTAGAAVALGQALQIDRRLGQPDRVALDLLLAAELEDQRGNRALATDLLQRALAVYAAIGDTAQAEPLRRRLAAR